MTNLMGTVIAKSIRRLYGLLQIYLMIGIVGALTVVTIGALSGVLSLELSSDLPSIENEVFKVALLIFLLIGATKLTLEEFASLMTLFKKMRTRVGEKAAKKGTDGPSDQPELPSKKILRHNLKL